ncbi:MAG: methyltransferase domain-containing protein [Acidobacteria bacterium]|nr:methyltransferase domain-containing protein [Acidobacteriota bacterium]MBK8148270.1 methyltransferase domain-containing protein [Acidobacteriota bacterium]MBK8813448.1 methyltransferase domain-containing protein [Acidobacteriota bacterium]
MNENIQFLQAFLKNPLKVGSIAPSSPELAAAMIAGMKPERDNIVLELGVGTGAITKFLQEIIPDEESYLGIELDRDLVRSLKRNYPDLKIVCGNACETVSIHQRSGLGKVGFVICCLPFVSLPNEVGDKILSEIDLLMQNGCTFRTFQYAHGYYMPSAIKLREFMRARYGKSKRSPLIVKNVPPAYTLTWATK